MTPALAPDTLLVRAPDVRVHLTDDDEMSIDAGGERVHAPRVALRLLDAFARPRTLASALAEIGGPGPEHFIEASTVALQLVRASILVLPGERERARASGFVKPSIHIAMLDDITRTRAFCSALRALVGPSDVVVDIGTGTGVLATCAALAGARKVVAIESTGIADVAERVFAANGISDRVELVRERSTTATLTERGTILVTETIGNDPLDEHILEIVSDARRRLLVPNARVVPSSLEIIAVPVDVPRSVFERHVFTTSHVERYRTAYGIDFTPLLGHRLGTAQPIAVKTVDARTWSVVGLPVTIASMDLEGDVPTAFSTKARIALDANVALLGVILAFRATLAPGIVLSTMPGEVAADNAWRYVAWPAIDHRDLPRGAEMEIEYRYERGTSVVRFERL